VTPDSPLTETLITHT